MGRCLPKSDRSSRRSTERSISCPSMNAWLGRCATSRERRSSKSRCSAAARFLRPNGASRPHNSACRRRWDREMGNLERATDLIRTRVRADWDEKHLELAALRVEGRRRQRKRMAVAFYTTTAAAAVVALYFLGAPTFKPREAPVGTPVAKTASAT